MIELFQNVSKEIKEQAKLIFDYSLQQTDPLRAAQILNDFLNICYNPEDHEFVEFYFKLRMEQINYERAINLWKSGTR